MFGNNQKQSKGFYEKLFIKSFLIISGLALFVFPATGQSKTEEYQKIIAAAYQKLSGVSYRLKSLKKASTGFVGNNTMITAEFAPPDKSSLIKTIDHWSDDDLGADKPEKLQTVTLGKKRFVKIDAGDWKEIGEAEYAKLGNDFEKYLSLKDLTYPVSNLTIETAAQEALNGRKTDVYKAKYVIDKRNYEVTYWIGADGLLIKTEYLVKFKEITIQMTETYEYDANIRIEAPKLN
jgi:hypothetical protein